MGAVSTGGNGIPTGSDAVESLVVAGRGVRLRRDAVDDGVRLIAAISFDRIGDDEAVLTRMDLASRGDTTFVIEGGEVVGRRLIVAPRQGELTEAAYGLAKQVVMARTLLSAGRPEEADEVVPPPDFPPIPGIDDVFAQYVTVASPRPAWTAPDASSPSVRELQPGELLSELERLGDWSRVSCNDGSVVYTDGRALVPFLKGERQ